MEEEKVFVHFSALLIYGCDGSEGLAEFQLGCSKITNPVPFKSGFGFILFIAPWKILSPLNTLF